MLGGKKMTVEGLAENAMTFGTWGLAVANLPQIWNLFIKRKKINGISREFALLSFLSLILITISFISIGWIWSVIAQIPPLVTWGTISWILWKE